MSMMLRRFLGCRTAGRGRRGCGVRADDIRHCSKLLFSCYRKTYFRTSARFALHRGHCFSLPQSAEGESRPTTSC